jgi:ADP-ribose pyrophosphatase YjhB (NUDIX family)
MLRGMDVPANKGAEDGESSTALSWTKRLQAIAQTGLTYAKDEYDIERYRNVRQVAAEMLAANFSGVSATQLVDLFARDIGYATPKVDVRAAVFTDKGLLLVRERSDGAWTLPGGWADVGDSPSLAAVREVKEESGYDVVARKLVAVYDRDHERHGHPPMPYHVYKLFFLCETVGGVAKASIETDAVSFFAENRIPPLSLARVTPEQITHLFDHHRHPEWPTSFD